MAGLDPERTLCPHCGRKTQTASDGVCVECWEDKTKKSVYAPGQRPPPEPPRPRGGMGSTWIDDLFDGSCCCLPTAACLVGGSLTVACYFAKRS